MDENLNKTENETEGTDRRHHHHHSSGRHHRHSSDGSSSEHHHHHHHSHSGVRVVTGRDARRLPWKDGLMLIFVCIIMFLILVLCTRFI